MRNVEIKAKVRNHDEIVETAKRLSDVPVEIVDQTDYFYNVPNGRLKMRFYGNGDNGTLVRYDREDIEGPKLADYDLFQLKQNDTNAKFLHDILKKSLGIKGSVIKERKLFLVGQTRIHIDTVENLGSFMELEVVLKPEQTLEEGQEIAKDLQKKLKVEDSDLIDCAYIDLLLKKK